MGVSTFLLEINVQKGWKFGQFYFKYSKVLKLVTSFDVFGVWIITSMFITLWVEYDNLDNVSRGRFKTWCFK